MYHHEKKDTPKKMKKILNIKKKKLKGYCLIIQNQSLSEHDVGIINQTHVITQKIKKKVI